MKVVFTRHVRTNPKVQKWSVKDLYMPGDVDVMPAAAARPLIELGYAVEVEDVESKADDTDYETKVLDTELDNKTEKKPTRRKRTTKKSK